MDQTAFRNRATTQVLLTASEAYPELERAFLAARSEIWASFLVFDLTTELRSPEARKIGQTWFDLMVATLRRGVSVHFAIADFDPVVRPEMHRMSWRSRRQFLAAAELAGPEAQLDMRVATHAARTGLLPRLAVWPMVAHRLVRIAARLDAMPPDHRAEAMTEMPGLAPLLRQGADGRVRARWWRPPELLPAIHHQKLAVFDRSRLYIGGLDLDERRFDTPDHDRPGRETWHDVQLLTEGPVVAEAQAHLETFLDATAGKVTPAPQRRFLRTLSQQRRFGPVSFGPKPVLQEIAEAHEALAATAQRLIYLESQYFRDRGLAQALARAARRNPRLSLILILPAAPDEVAFERATGLDSRFGEYLQARCLRTVIAAFRGRIFIGGAAQPRRGRDRGRAQMKGAPLVYIHAKVSVFDETAAIVSSANLNGRSLRWDTEAGLFLNRRDDVVQLRHRVMEHWLPDAAGPEFFDPVTAQQAWAGLALANASRPPEQRAGFLLPYDVKIAERFGVPLPMIPEEMV